jgi:hypothetical protein
MLQGNTTRLPVSSARAAADILAAICFAVGIVLIDQKVLRNPTGENSVGYCTGD